MLTGFNTDIRHSERVYHVQTEDRGPANPIIESLVYVGGEILLSKKSPYTEHVHGDKVDEKAVREMMDIQHRRILEAVRRGRLETKKPGEASLDFGEDTFPTPPGVSAAAVAAVAAILSAPVEPLPADERAPAAVKEKPEIRPPVRPVVSRPGGTPVSSVPSQAVPLPAPSPQPLPKPSDSAIGPSVRATSFSAESSDTFLETFVSSGPPSAAPATPFGSAPAAPRPTTSPAAYATASPARAAPVRPVPAPRLPSPGAAAGVPSGVPPPAVAPAAGRPKTLDQVIVDYLASEAASGRLELSIMAGAEFISGGTVPLTIIATTSISRKPIPGAQVTVRVVSTAAPAQILYRGLTGNDGMVKTSCALPEIGTANAALIIVGFSPIGSSEAKYLIRKKGT